MILIIIKFCELLLRISPRIINSLRSYIKHSKECFLLFPNTSKLVKKNSAAPRFSNLLLGVWKSEETLFLVFDLLPPNRYIPLTKWLVWPAIFWQIESALSLAHRPEIVGCGCFIETWKRRKHFKGRRSETVHYYFINFIFRLKWIFLNPLRTS